MSITLAAPTRHLPKGLFGVGIATIVLCAAATMQAQAPATHAMAAKATAPATPAAHAAHAARALDDATIVAIFDAANSWDIQTGNLAMKKGHDKDVREFAKMIAHDHTVVRQQGRDLAAKLHVTPTPPKPFAMYDDHLAAMKQLNSLSGTAFDKAFLEHEVAFHKAVIDAVTTTLLPAIQNAEVKDMVVKVAPAFQAHMARAQAILDSKAAH